MKRIFKALNAFSLTLALGLTLWTLPLGAAAQAAEAEGEYVGYLVMLDDQAHAPALFSAGEATLMAAYNEREELLPLVESMGIYKAGDLDDIQNLVWSGQVLSAEPDYKAELFDASDLGTDHLDPTRPNDPYFTEQNQNYQYNLKDSDLYGASIRAAWDAGLTGEGVSVAVIDSGLNTMHLDAPIKVGQGRYYYYREDPNGKWTFTVQGVTKRYNYYSSDYILDNLGHGSMVSGIIAANTNNRSDHYTGGIAGIAPNATIIPIRCFTAVQGHVGGYASNLISGINYAVQNGAHIINMSWGLREESLSLKNTLTAAANAGCILIAAAGNDGTSAVQYPAVYDNVISVGSVDNANRLSSFSQRSDKVNICAPGGGTGANQRIHSLWFTSEDAIGYGVGTSFSAPVVAAAAALLKEHDSTMTQQDFLTLLRNNSDPVVTGSADDQAYVGYGTLNMGKILNATGHTGAMIRYGEDGSVTVRAAHYPRSTGTSAQQSALALVGVYNAAGHLLDSVTATVTKPAGYSAYSHCVTFPSVDDAATVRDFFLDNGTLAPLAEPGTVPIYR